MFKTEDMESIKQVLMEKLQTEDNPESWLQGPAERYLNSDG